VPWVIVTLPAFPLTVNRKIARDRLPVPATATARRRPADGAGPSLTPAECRMVDIWNEILGTAAVGLDDDFFRIGGHSLTAMRVTARVREVFDVPVGVGELFQLRTPRRFVARVTDMSRRRAAAIDPTEGTHHGAL